MAKQTREQLGVKPGDKIVIKGKVSFAKIDKLVEGDALEKENARRQKFGMLVADKPFKSITIENPEVVSGKGSPLAAFYGQTVYSNKKTGAATMSIETKSKFGPTFGHIQNGKIVEIEDPQRNPNKDQVVYLMVEAYMPKGYNKLGSSFNAVVYEEGEIDFYNAGGGLSGFGEALGMEVEPLNTASSHTDVPDNAFGSNDAFPQTPVQEPQAQPAPQNNAFGIQDDQVNSGHPFANPQAQSGQTESNPFYGDSPFA